MKKGCLIVLIILAVLLIVGVVGAFVAYNAFDERVGLGLSRPISHQEAVVGDTRIRCVVNPEKLAPFVADYIPPNAEMPIDAAQVKQLLPYIVPREVALLARSDVMGRKLSITVFANEKRLGRAVQEFANAEGILSKISQINWTTNGFELPERGFLLAEGDMPIPESVEKEIFELWPTQAKEGPATIEGGSQLELVVDNRNGDILAVAAALVTAGGEDWATLRASDYGAMAIGVIESIYVARVKANLTDKDTLSLDLHIDSDAEKGPGLQLLLSGLVIPGAKEQLKKNYGLVLDGDVKWNAADNTIAGNLKVTGLEAVIRAQIAKNMPAPAPAQP